MNDRRTEAQPTAWEASVFDALVAIAYEFNAEPATALSFSNSTVQRLRAALGDFTRTYPNWCATRNERAEARKLTTSARPLY
jgi:hypothetical protein